MATERPKREQYALDRAGDYEFAGALVQWQYDEIERLQRANAELLKRNVILSTDPDRCPTCGVQR